MNVVPKRYIEVPFSFYYKHKYEQAPEDVKFLREIHNHNFECKVSIRVFHSDRELEFYIVRNYLETIIPSIKYEIRSYDYKWSCEMISDFIHKKLIERYGERSIEIKVTEDGMYGSKSIYEVEEK